MKTINSYFTLLVALFSCAFSVSSQTNKIDSLQSVLAKDTAVNKEHKSSTLRLLGVAFFEIGNYAEAINNYEKALQIGKDINNEKTISRCLLNIGNVHLRKGNYPLALEYLNKSLEINEKIKDTTLISLALNNMGIIYRNLENYDKAIDLSQRALEIQKKQGNKKRTAETLNSLSLFHIQMKNYAKAHENLSEALAICRDINNTYIEGFTLNNIGYVYLNSEEYKDALTYYEKAKKTNLSIDSKSALMVSYYGLSKAYTGQKKYGQALPNALKSLQLSKNLNITSFEKDIQELLSSIYQKSGKYEKALASYQAYKKLNDSIFNKKNIEKIAQLESEYKYQKALDSANIRELQLTKTVAATNENLVKTQQNYLWAVIGVLMISMLLGSIIFYQKLNHAKAKTQNAVIEQKLLRSQMTPHFIFNSLSVLQGMILNKEDKKSVSYLSKFSKLLRITLENSRDKTVSLEKELKAIENYLALQNLENDAYEYSILVEETIEAAMFEIPPMLIQPFVENSVEHAFVNTKDNMKIDVRLTFNSKKLICTITDNGIGYEYQKETKNGHKKSLATAITSERLKMLSKDLGMQGSVTIEDRTKYNEQGTLVTLVIPHKLVAVS